MVDRRREILEEVVQGSGVSGVESRPPLRANVLRRLAEPARVAASEDDLGPLGPGVPGCPKTDP